MIHAIGLERSEVYICNVVKCRPPANRDPAPEEAETCLPYLRAQVALVRPKVIALLGAWPASTRCASTSPSPAITAAGSSARACG